MVLVQYVFGQPKYTYISSSFYAGLDPTLKKL